jgi:hypothetical protein
LATQGTCNQQLGCSWSTSGTVCMGTVTACNLLPTASACRTQPGCVWQ